MMALQSRETRNITLKNLALFKLQLNVPIRLQDLAKNNDAEFSIRVMQLTRFLTKLLRQAVEDFSGLF